MEAPAVHSSGVGHIGARGRCPVQAALTRPIGHRPERKEISCSRRSCTPSERWRCWPWPWVRASSPTNQEAHVEALVSGRLRPTLARASSLVSGAPAAPSERPTPVRVSAYRPSTPSADAGTPPSRDTPQHETGARNARRCSDASEAFRVETPSVHRSGAGHVGARGRCPLQAPLRVAADVGSEGEEP